MGWLVAGGWWLVEGVWWLDFLAWGTARSVRSVTVEKFVRNDKWSEIVRQK
jgi:hypothetical protein